MRELLIYDFLALINFRTLEGGFRIAASKATNNRGFKFLIIGVS